MKNIIYFYILFLLNVFLHCWNNQLSWAQDVGFGTKVRVKIIKKQNNFLQQTDTVITVSGSRTLSDIAESMMQQFAEDDDGQTSISVEIEEATLSQSTEYTPEKIACSQGLFPQNVKEVCSTEAQQENRAFLGVYIAEAPGGGVFVENVVPNGAAALAGIQAGDMLLAINADPTGNCTSLKNALLQYHPADKVQITYLHLDDTLHSQVVMQSAPTPCPPKCERTCCNKPAIGVIGDHNYETSGNGGVLVARVLAASPAQKAGLQRGDLLLSFDGKSIQTESHLKKLVADHLSGDVVHIGFKRQGALLSTSLTLLPHTQMLHQPQDTRLKNTPAFDELLKTMVESDIAEEENHYHWRSGSSENSWVMLTNEGTNRAFCPNTKYTVRIDDLDDDDKQLLKTFSPAFDAKKLPLSKLELYDLAFEPQTNGQDCFELSFKLKGNGTTSIQLYTDKGKCLLKDELANFGGTYKRQITLPEQGNGFWYLQVRQKEQVSIKKIWLE